MSGKSEENNGRIYGRNSVLEALRSDAEINRIYVQEGLFNGVISTIVKLAKEKKIPLSFERKDILQKMCGSENHQGAICDIAEAKYYELADLFSEAEQAKEDPFFLILDGILDPHNLGAIIRTAHQAGAHGIIIPKNRAASLTGTVSKVSAGAIQYMKVCRVTNLAATLRELKERGLWIAAADMDGQSMYDANLKGPIGLLIGSEGRGVSKLLLQESDFTVSIPMKGKIDSLNASVSAGILCYEILRQRSRK